METEPPSINLSDAEKEILLSYAYCLGAGVVENAAEVVGFFRKYAEAGHAFAQNTLGKMYFKGDWVEKDDVEAIKWLTKAAEAEVEKYALSDKKDIHTTAPDQNGFENTSAI